MAALVAQTPPRPGPGLYPQTPAPSRPALPAPSFGTSTRGALLPPQDRSQSQAITTIQQPDTPANAAVSVRPVESLKPVERAARSINTELYRVTQFPELDTYLSQGISCEYDLKSSPIWAPFQKVRMHNIPDQVFEQLNRAQVSTSMGLFAELRYAWVAIDNALYLWDYTLNNPELLGYEEQPYSITAVRLAKPKPGVFTAAIKHMIVLATTEQIILLGLGQDPSAGAASLTLFQTGMTASVKGQVVTQIECSAKTGRIFFGGETNNDLHELTYQASESWFGSRCKDNNLTRSYNESYNPMTKLFGSSSTEFVDQIVVDDTRDLVYTLSSKSSIRVFYMSSGGGIDLKITKDAKDTYANIGHIISPSDTLNPRIRLVSISPIPKDEAGRYHLVATTETGYRIYLSATTYGYGSSNASYPPQSMQALHVRTPPLVAANPGEPLPSPHQTNNYLRVTTIAKRFPPGYFFCSTARDAKAPVNNLFVSAPDAARLSQPPEAGQPAKSTEPACWIQLNSKAEDIGVSVPYSPPSPDPRGFGSDISVQYDKSIPEVAILTNTGVHVLRRRRFVDSFSAMIRAGGGPEGFETEINNLIRSYGREEILSSALAVACGQGMEVSQERPTRINDPEVLEVARKVFIDYGGKPSIDQNKIIDKTLPPIDAVRPSHRHDAVTRYIARIIRSCWRHTIAKEERSVAGYAITPAVPLDKLRAVQEDLVALNKFFNVNKSFIRGLSGPDDLGRQASKDDEIALQGEHRALHSLVKFVSDTIEGISFILVLFEEKVADIVPLLPEPSRPVFLQLTFEELFCTSKGHDLARDLVKAIVNRNIAKGSNVETIAEALRRKCGSFCSSDDVIIFKAQEQLKRAAEAKANAEFSRNLLNESLKLFEQVASSLPWDYLQSAVKDYIELQFFAGAVQLTLKVANELDKTNEALAWVTEGRLDTDARKAKYDRRNRCYDLIHDILIALDKYVLSSPAFVDGRPTLAGQRRDEVFDVISKSKDEVFLTNLYDWYLSQGWHDKLLSSDSPFIIVYLQRKSNEDLAHADLLWKYYTQQQQFQDAARVQLGLAQSSFPLKLSKRLEYLSRAKANASAFSTTNTLTRKAKQKLLAEINELLDIANIQDEILARLRSDPRHESAEKRNEVLSELDGAIKTVSDLFNSYAERAAYFDICLLIYFIADHRDSTLIKATWQNLFTEAHERAVANNKLADSAPNGNATGQIAAPYEHVAQAFRDTASRLRSSETIFPVPALIEMLERYALTQRADTADGRVHWVVDAFLELDVPFEAVYDALETLFFTDSKPRDQRFFMADLLYVAEKWLASSLKSGVVFGGEQGTARVSELVKYVVEYRVPGGRGDTDSVGTQNRAKGHELLDVMSRLLA